MSKFNAVNAYRKERWCSEHGLHVAAKMIRAWIYLIHNSYIPYTCKIGSGTTFAYKGIGLIIHANAKIGDDCTIGSNVTIGGGGAGSAKDNRIEEFESIRGTAPVIGDRCYISTGAKILGSIVIGDDVIIGANAVVITDVPPNVVVRGGYRPRY